MTTRAPAISPLDGVLAGLHERGVSRRAFLRFCGAVTALLALPSAYAPRVSAALTTAPRLPLVWLRGSGCGGDSAAFLRASSPGVAELFLEFLSVDYFEPLMIASGASAAARRSDVLTRYPNGYIAIVEGAVATGADGAFHVVGGQPFSHVVKDVCDGALATIAVGSCAFDGGLAAAGGGVSGSTGVAGVVASPRFLALPGCPVNVANLAAAIVHYLTFKEMPPTDMRGRPLFAYGALIHNECERRAHFEFGEFVLEWGDEGAQKGWCLYKLGCKGPQTFANCASTRYDDGASWNVAAGHGCIGCTMPAFWDAMGPAYARLPGTLPFAPDISADTIGWGIVGGVTALAAVHGTASIVRFKRRARLERRAALAAATIGPALPEAPAAPAPQGAPVGEPAAPAEEPVVAGAAGEPTGTEAEPPSILAAPAEPDAIDEGAESLAAEEVTPAADVVAPLADEEAQP